MFSCSCGSCDSSDGSVGCCRIVNTLVVNVGQLLHAI